MSGLRCRSPLRSVTGGTPEPAVGLLQEWSCFHPGGFLWISRGNCMAKDLSFLQAAPAGPDA